MLKMHRFLRSYFTD